MLENNNGDSLNKDQFNDIDSVQNKHTINMNSSSGHHHSSHRRHHHKRRIKKKTIIVTTIVIGVILALGLSCLAAFFIMKDRGENSLRGLAISDKSSVENSSTPLEVLDENTLRYNGELYRYKEDMITLLGIGVDTSGEIELQDAGNGGQADTIFLIALDPTNKKMKIIGVSRNTMTGVDVYGLTNELIGTKKLQLAFAYAFGDGEHTSCENTAKAVSNLFYGIPIHGYYAMNVNGIIPLNDTVGGVKVTIDEDMTSKNLALQKGATVTLKGKQAYWYVRYRNCNEFGSNEKRLTRQKNYMISFVNTAKQAIKQNFMLPVDLYKAIEPYTVTNIDLSEVTYLTNIFMDCGFDSNEITLLKGTTKMGTVYEEYYVDETALYELILDVYYNKIPS